MYYNIAAPVGHYIHSEYITLLPTGRFYENRERTLSYLRELDPDRMLYNFRTAFGVDTKGAEPLGGWEEPTGLLRGHSTGHYISALSIAVSATGEELFREKLRYMVHELRKLQLMSKGDPAAFKTACTAENPSQENWSKNPGEWGEGFLSAYSPDQFALLEQFVKYKDIWAPYYTLHKIVAGMIECYSRVYLDEALDVAKDIGNWIHARLSAVSAEHRKKMWSLYIAGEFGGMNESMARLYALTGDEKYLETARMFDNGNVFPGLAEGVDTIMGLHANQHIPQIIGAHHEYRATGEDFYKSVAENFFHIVTHHHMYAIGGVGQGESFRGSDALAANIKEDTNCETCAAYNLLKLARDLAALDPENTAYMEYYERALINQILASQCEHITPDMLNGVTYMLPIGPGAVRSYSDNYNSFTCCHGTGMENHVKYTDASFLLTEDALYINQYVPASVKGAVDVRIENDFPFGGVRVALEFNRDFTAKLRIPSWCDNPFPELSREGNFAVARGKAGEKFALCGEFTYSLRWETTPDELDGSAVAALMYGPFVMVTEDPSKEWISLDSDLEKYKLIPGDVPILSDGARTFIPMYAAGEKPYHAYFKLK
ncbi:MAG: glycoside hydrolase family 127 protein [Oscillospiraceae bacterium]|nr:glycoside hydrolase family 127 protein [Oscillospiraceae bacterium]